jgi:hypothetical protein
MRIDNRVYLRGGERNQTTDKGGDLAGANIKDPWRFIGSEEPFKSRSSAEYQTKSRHRIGISPRIAGSVCRVGIGIADNESIQNRFHSVTVLIHQSGNSPVCDTICTRLAYERLRHRWSIRSN